MSAIMRDEHAASNNVPVTTTSHSGANVMGLRHSITLLCQHCGTPFQTHEPRKVTCSRPCMSARIAAGAAKRQGANNGLFKHGAKPRTGETSEYASWRGMRERCANPNHKGFHYYGGRGITVWPAWDEPVNGFTVFLAYMGPKPENRAPNGKVDCCLPCRRMKGVRH